LKCDWWCSYFDTTGDQTTVSYIPFIIPVINFPSHNWCDTTDSFLRFISTVGQTTVSFFFSCNFFRWFKKHSRPDDCTFFSGRNFFSDCNWCLYFDMNTNYGTYNRKKIRLRQLGGSAAVAAAGSLAAAAAALPPPAVVATKTPAATAMARATTNNNNDDKNEGNGRVGGSGVSAVAVGRRRRKRGDGGQRGDTAAAVAG
jgi:hypothetical protein